MNPLPADAAVFESHPPKLLALVKKRLELQRSFHRRADLPALDPDLFDLARELGLLLCVVYRYGLAEALEEVGRGGFEARKCRNEDDRLCIARCRERQEERNGSPFQGRSVRASARMARRAQVPRRGPDRSPTRASPAAG